MSVVAGLLSNKGNALAIERMREKDQQDRLQRINTKQKRGTPMVREPQVGSTEADTYAT